MTHAASGRRQAAVAAAWVVAAASGAAAADCTLTLSDAQRERFQLASQQCATLPAKPRDAADALVASGGMPALPPRPRDQESAHLRLFTPGAGVVVKSGASPAPAVRAPVSRSPARSAPRTGTLTVRALQMAPQIDATARRHDIDPLLLHAIAHVESRHDPRAVSPAGARGVMQVMPATGARFGVKAAGALHDADTNLEASAAYLKTLQRRFDGDLVLVLAAYNAGEGAVELHGRSVPPFPETQRYVVQVLQWYGRLQRSARAVAM